MSGSTPLNLPLKKSSNYYVELVSALERVDRGDLTINTIIREFTIPEIHILNNRAYFAFGFYINNRDTASALIKNVIRRLATTADTGLMTSDELVEWGKCKDLFQLNLCARNESPSLCSYQGTFVCSLLALLLAPQSLDIGDYAQIKNPNTAFGKSFMEDFKSLYIEENLKQIFETAT